MAYLDDVLDAQRLTQPQIDGLRNLRQDIEGVLTGGWNADPRFYYGGSFAKNTMISADYDLDIVMYFPSTAQFTVKAIYEAVESRLAAKKYFTQRRNVAIRLPYQNGIHIDVVPGRAIAPDFKYAQLYARAFDTTKQTSVKVHIDQVRKNGGYQEVVKLLKLWRLRNGIDITSFALEIAVAKALAGNRGDLADRFWKMLHFLRDDFPKARLVDPANTNNIVSDEISQATKQLIWNAASNSLQKRNWNEII